MIGWEQIIVAAVQIGYSWWLKNYSTMNNKYIPLLNVGTALVYFSVFQLATNPEAGLAGLGAALVAILVKSAETALLSTGIHSAAKNLSELKQ